MPESRGTKKIHCVGKMQYLGASTELRRATTSFVMSACLSVCTHGTIWLQSDGFSWNLIYEYFSKKSLSRKFKFKWNLIRITGALHEDLWTLTIICRCRLLLTENISVKYRENQNTYCIFDKFPISPTPPPENRVVYELTWKNAAQTDWSQMTI